MHAKAPTTPTPTNKEHPVYRRIIRYYLIPGAFLLLTISLAPFLFDVWYYDNYTDPGNVLVQVNLGDGRLATMMVTVPEGEDVYFNFDLPAEEFHRYHSVPDTVPAVYQGMMTKGDL